MIRQQTIRGSILLICLALTTAMVALAFTFIGTMQRSASIGPTSYPITLSRQAARTAVGHVFEVLLHDYTKRATAITSDASPHRILFDPIDSHTISTPYELSTKGSNPKLFMGNDVPPSLQLLNPYRRFWGHMGFGFFPNFDHKMVGAFVTPTTPRYIESCYWGIDLAKEYDSTTALTFSKASATALTANDPLYFDSQWRPVAKRSDARYRVRYAAMVQDLSGCLLLGVPAEFSRNDPFAPDGELMISNTNMKGLEIDRSLGLKYAATATAFAANKWSSNAGDNASIGGSPGPHALLLPMLGGTANPADDYAQQHGGFTESTIATNQILQGSPVWIGRYDGKRINMDTYSLNHTVSGSINNLIAGRHSSWHSLSQSLFGNEYSVPLHVTTTTPYQSPTHINPASPETGAYKTLPYNAGPTDCPWRINPLTASAAMLHMAFQGFRAQPHWNRLLTKKITLSVKGISSTGNRIWETFPDGTSPLSDIKNWYEARISNVTPAVPDNTLMPTIFRNSFTSKVRGSTNDARPFAQFFPSKSSIDPRSQTDPLYPSPAHLLYGTELGKFSDLHNRGAIFFNTHTSRAVGPCVPRLDRQSRPSLLTRFPGWRANTSLNHELDPDTLPSRYLDTKGTLDLLDDKLEIYISEDFINWNDDDNKNWAYDSGESTSPASWKAPALNTYHDSNTAEGIPHDYYWDAITALASSVSVSIACHQPGVRLPKSIAGCDYTQFQPSMWGNPTLDTDLDKDGWNETCSAFRNIADLDRLFLRILGEDPDNPALNATSLPSIYAVHAGMGTNAKLEQAASVNFTKSSFRPYLRNLPSYNASTERFTLDFDNIFRNWSFNSSTQCPFPSPIVPSASSSESIDPTENYNLINLRRYPLKQIASSIYPSDPAFTTEASSYVVSAHPLSSQAIALKKLQLMRCRLRDAERMINDMRMSFFGANPTYLDRNGERFRPMDLDGDGWAISSAYAPGDMTPVVHYDNLSSTAAIKPTPYRFSEPLLPADWSNVVYDEYPDDPTLISGGRNITDVNRPVWVCFKDIADPIAGEITSVSNSSLPGASIFRDHLTYANVNDGDDAASPPQPLRPAGLSQKDHFGDMVKLAGYTRWFYPASRVANATSSAWNGRAAFAVDTYFSVSGYFVLEKSRFYRVISRGEVWDEIKRQIVGHSILETVLMIDPDGDVYSKDKNIDPSTGQVADASGIIDSCITYQRWMRDMYTGAQIRSVADR